MIIFVAYWIGELAQMVNTRATSDGDRVWGLENQPDIECDVSSFRALVSGWSHHFVVVVGGLGSITVLTGGCSMATYRHHNNIVRNQTDRSLNDAIFAIDIIGLRHAILSPSGK